MYNNDFFLERQERLIPGSIEAGFSIFTAMLHVIQRNKDLMSDAISLINEIGIKMNNISLSNWICKNAYAGEFHQDKDSSYSLIYVPFINHSESSHLKLKKVNMGLLFVGIEIINLE